MKKHRFVKQSGIRKIVLSACLVGAAVSDAGAQSSFRQSAELGAQGREASMAGLDDGGAMGSVGGQLPASPSLPVITNPRRDSRQTPAPVTTRPAKSSSISRDAFVAYVEKVTGSNLGIFGRDLFNDVPSTFSPMDGAQVNLDYVIGSGDEVQIRGWGMVDIDLSATVSRSGEIFIPRVGAVKISGVKYRDLQGYLKKAVGRIFNNFDLTASIAQTRAVQIYVVGHAMRPGTYTLSSMSTLLNALFTSGGPNETGSMRNIQVKRGGQVATSFDLYDMLLKGDKGRDIALQDGDVIFIPEVGPLVALSGNVKQAAIFELKGPASLADLLAWAGGVDSAAEAQRVIVEKNVDNNYRTIADLNSDKSSRGLLAGIPVSGANILRVFAPSAVPVPAQIQNEYVRVAGEVKQSGVFQLSKGETLKDLVARLGGVTDNGYVYATQLTRDSVRRAQQEKLDEAARRFERDVESNAAQRISGTTDKDTAAGIAAEAEQQRRLVQKLRSVKAEGRIVLELQDGRAQAVDLPDIPLQNGDSIYIPRKPGTVDVSGAVFQQNAFFFKPLRTVSEYLMLAGGVTMTADKSEMYVIRADGTAQSPRNTSWFGGGMGGVALSPGDMIVVPEKIERSSFMQSVKEWTAIFYQFGLGAAGLKVLKD